MAVSVLLMKPCPYCCLGTVPGPCPALIHAQARSGRVLIGTGRSCGQECHKQSNVTDRKFMFRPVSWLGLVYVYRGSLLRTEPCCAGVGMRGGRQAQLR